MNVLPILLGVMMALSFGTSDYLSKGVTSKIGSYRTTIYILGFSGVGTLIPALFLRSSFEVTPLLGALLVFIAVTTFLAFAALYRAYKGGLLSITAPIANSYPALSVLISVIFLGVTFSTGAIVALAVVIFGIVMVSTSFSDLRKRVLARNTPLAPGVGAAMMSALFFGVSWVAFGYASEHLGYLLPTVSVRIAAAAVGVALIPVIKPELKPVSGRWLPRILIMSSLETIGVVIFNVGVTVSTDPSTVPILATFAGMSSAVIVVYAIVLLKEKIEINHVVGIISLITGVAVLLYLTN